ncbi:MAG: hypothetical protein VST66_00290, partial [Nitrospirota bacterium]|nr:hypothetical protein [Nitrospirota bacterium]
KQVGNSLRPRSLQQSLDGLPLVFPRDKSKGLAATYHFTFTGKESRKATGDHLQQILAGVGWAYVDG